MPHFCACPKTGPGLTSANVTWSFLVFNNLKRELVVRYVDISGIIDHH
jgi:hypothetical protein